MAFQPFPAFYFHKEHAPEGRLFQTAEEFADAGPGWHDTPAKFNPNYVEPPPPPVAEGDVPADAPNYVPQPYPAHLFDRSGSGESRLVASAEEHAELEKQEPGKWIDTPDVRAYEARQAKKKADAEAKSSAADVPPAPPAASTASASAEGGESAPNPGSPAPKVPPVNLPVTSAPPEPSTPVTLTDEQIAKFYAAKMVDIVAELEAVGNPGMLEALQAAESARPGDVRNGVVKALKARLKVLASPVEE